MILKSFDPAFQLFVGKFLRFSLQFFDARGADILPLEIDHILDTFTENAGGLIFPQNNGCTIHKNFKGIPLRNVQRTAQLDGKNDAAQFIHSANDSC